MSGVPVRLLRHMLREGLVALLVCLAGIVGIYLIIDFADRAHHYQGEGAAQAVALLYACKALVVGHQLFPAVALLGASAAASGMRARNEVAAMAALTITPRWIHAALLLLTLGAVGCDVALDEALIGKAGQKADRLMAERFQQWGDFTSFFGRRSWFRSGDRIYLLRGEEDGVFTQVSLFEVDAEMRLQRRIDAARMEPLGAGLWRLRDGAWRTFSGGDESEAAPFKELELKLDASPDHFTVRLGRPEQLRFTELGEEARRRAELGLVSQPYLLARQLKLAGPLRALPAALLGIALALRRNRKGHLTATLVEGVVVVAVMWGADILFRALAGAGHLGPATAAWLPLVLLSVAAVWLARRLE